MIPESPFFDTACRVAGRLDEDNERTRVLSYEEEGRLMAQLVGRRRHLRPVVARSTL